MIKMKKDVRHWGRNLYAKTHQPLPVGRDVVQPYDVASEEQHHRYECGHSGVGHVDVGTEGGYEVGQCDAHHGGQVVPEVLG
jgi:hypothetical protein